MQGRNRNEWFSSTSVPLCSLLSFHTLWIQDTRSVHLPAHSPTLRSVCVGFRVAHSRLQRPQNQMGPVGPPRTTYWSEFSSGSDHAGGPGTHTGKTNSQQQNTSEKVKGDIGIFQTNMTGCLWIQYERVHARVYTNTTWCQGEWHS